MKVFKTGQVAKICKVTPRTVIKWFDSGRLKGYRIPNSNERRIPREYLIKFLKEHGMPIPIPDELGDDDLAKVLVASQSPGQIERIKHALPPERSFKVRVASDGFSVGILIGEGFRPDCIVVDFVDPEESSYICKNILRHLDLGSLGNILLVILSDVLPRELYGRVDGSFLRSFDEAALCEKLLALIGAKKDLR